MPASFRRACGCRPWRCCKPVTAADLAALADSPRPLRHWGAHCPAPWPCPSCSIRAAMRSMRWRIDCPPQCSAPDSLRVSAPLRGQARTHRRSFPAGQMAAFRRHRRHHHPAPVVQRRMAACLRRQGIRRQRQAALRSVLETHRPPKRLSIRQIREAALAGDCQRQDQRRVALGRRRFAPGAGLGPHALALCLTVRQAATCPIETSQTRRESAPARACRRHLLRR